MNTANTWNPATSGRRVGGIRLSLMLGSVAWLVGAVQYFATQRVVAGAWHPPYSWTQNYISDLGNTACGAFSVPHGTAMYVCSPRHGVMNGSFVLSGALFIVGARLLRRWWPSTIATRRAATLFGVAGIGKIIVGLVPENTKIGWHLLGSLNVPLVSIAIIMLAVATRATDPMLSRVGFAMGIVGLIGTTLSTLDEFAGSGFYFGLGVGGMERIASYPGTLWTVLIAVMVMIRESAIVKEGAAA